MDALAEMHELERLWQESPHSVEFERLRRQSKWGERAREEVIQGIKRGQADAIEDGILFLEVNPRYFRSGYFKATITSKLKGAALSGIQQERLRKVVLHAIESENVGPEFSEYARLAVVVGDTEFLAEVSKRLQANAGWIRTRCARVIALCQRHSRT